MRRATSAAALAALGLLTAACVGTPVHIDGSIPAGLDKRTARVVEGGAGSFQLLILIPIRHNSRHERAWEELKAKAPDCYLTNVQMQERWIYAFVGTGYVTTFRATAYPKSGTTAAPADAAPVADTSTPDASGTR